MRNYQRQLRKFSPFPIHRIWTRLITGRRTRVPRRCYASVHKPGAEAEKYKTMAKTISLNVALSNRRPCLENPNTRFDVGKKGSRGAIFENERGHDKLVGLKANWIEMKLNEPLLNGLCTTEWVSTSAFYYRTLFHFCLCLIRGRRRPIYGTIIGKPAVAPRRATGRLL